MIITDNMRTIAKQILFVISIHTIMLIVNSYAHQKISFLFNMSAYSTLLMVLCILPIMAALFLQTQTARQGAVILLGVLPAELIYNIINRFTKIPPIFREEADLMWIIIYEASFGIVLLLEVIGFWLTWKMLREIHKQIKISTK